MITLLLVMLVMHTLLYCCILLGIKLLLLLRMIVSLIEGLGECERLCDWCELCDGERVNKNVNERECD